MTSGILPKISPPTLLHLSLLSLTLTAVLPSHLSLRLNSTLKLSDYIPSDSFMPVIKILHNDVFYTLSGHSSWKPCGPDGMPPVIFKICASVLTPCLVKLFRLCLSTSTYPSCLKYAKKEWPRKGDRSNPSNYRPIALLSSLSEAFESILNRKIQKHLSTFDLSGRQYGFRKARSSVDPLSVLTYSWSSSHSRFGETFSVALDISKAFDRVWHKSTF